MTTLVDIVFVAAAILFVVAVIMASLDGPTEPTEPPPPPPPIDPGPVLRDYQARMAEMQDDITRRYHANLTRMFYEHLHRQAYEHGDVIDTHGTVKERKALPPSKERTP